MRDATGGPVRTLLIYGLLGPPIAALLLVVATVPIPPSLLDGAVAIAIAIALGYRFAFVPMLVTGFVVWLVARRTAKRWPRRLAAAAIAAAATYASALAVAMEQNDPHRFAPVLYAGFAGIAALLCLALARPAAPSPARPRASAPPASAPTARRDAPFAVPRPEPATVALAGEFSTADNPIHALLDAHGVPWRTPRRMLLERFGRCRDPLYSWDICPIETAPPLVDGMLRPLSFNAPANDWTSPDVPATSFSTTVWWEDDASANLLRAHAAIAARLGHRPIEKQANTCASQWRRGPAWLRLTVFPPALNTDAPFSPAHEREPRLATAVLLAIETGYRPALSQRERGWLDSFVPVETLGPRAISAEEIRRKPAREHVLEFVREPPDDLERFTGCLGRSADGEGLILVRDQLYVAPMASLTGFQVTRLTQAKGSAGSWIAMGLKTSIPDRPVKYIEFATSADTYGLDATAERLATLFDRPFSLEPPVANA